VNIVWSRISDVVVGWWLRRSDAFRAAVVTSSWTFAATVSPVVLAAVNDLQQWVLVGGDLPDLEQAGRTIAAAGFGFLAGVGNYIFRRIKPGPVYPRSNR
jgi:hypothetical protein